MGVEVCPVHRSEFKKSLYIPYIHVGAMSQHSQPGGLKRKRPDDEDEDEDPPSAPSPNRRQPHTENKQHMLELTYSKLERFKYTPNSSLSRYVLILNTIRNFEQEMIRDGIRLMPPGTFIPTVNHQVPLDATRPSPSDDAKTNVEDVVTSLSDASASYAMDTDAKTATTSVINASDAPSDIFGGLSSAAPYASGVSEYVDRYLTDLDGPSSGRATPFVRGDAESCALWNEDSDRLTSLNWSSVLNMSSVDGGPPIAASSFYPETAVESSVANCNFDASSNSSSGCSSDCSISDDAMSSSETSLHTLMPVTTGMNSVGGVSSSTSSSSSPRVTSVLGSSSSQSGSSPPNSEDEIFGDIDLALYDYDFTPLSPPNVRMAPVSAEELMQSLSSDQRVENIGEHMTSVRT